MTQSVNDILKKLFIASISGNKGVDAKKFRAQNYQHLDLLDDLENSRYIEIIDENYFIRLVPLLKLAETVRDADHIFFLSELIFKALHSFYLESPGQYISLNNLAERTDLPRSDINKALSYMIQSHIFGGYSTKFHNVEDANVTPGERILRFNSFKEVVEDLVKMQAPSSDVPLVDTSIRQSSNYFEEHQYINQSRILELEKLQSEQFDFTRLIQICHEINHCAFHMNYLALGALIRMLLDHIPPIFEFSTFKEVASNYKAGKSLKGSLKNLENSSRNISDGLLHQAIRRKETVPTLNQVNFSPDIDVLISEIIRKLDCGG